MTKLEHETKNINFVFIKYITDNNIQTTICVLKKYN